MHSVIPLGGRHFLCGFNYANKQFVGYKKGEKRMIKMKNKLIAILAIALLTISMSSLLSMQLAEAHTPAWQIPTYAYINVAPDPVGVGQQAAVMFWIDKVPPSAVGSIWGPRFHNMTITVTDPDGKVETLGPYDSDATGGTTAVSYIPTKVGAYTFVGHFPTQTIINQNPYPYNTTFPQYPEFIGDTYLASDSQPTTLTVQQDPIQTAYPSNPLPTNYWDRPINSMNRNWYVLGGNWLGLAATRFGYTGVYDANNGNFNPYTTAPNSAHVLWTKPLAFGGQIGGAFGEDSVNVYATGTAYEAKFGPVIINGVLYYTQYPDAANDPGLLTAVDMRSGKVLWTTQANKTLLCGMVYNFANGDQYGAHSYLFTGPPASGVGFIVQTPMTWSMYDAATGKWILDISNANAGTLTTGPSGELLSYSTNGTALTLWNASKCIETASQKLNTYRLYSAAEIWRPPQGATIDWRGGNQWIAPIATNISGAAINPALSISKVSNDVVLMTAMNTYIPGRSQYGYMVKAGYSATDGHLLWGPTNITETPFTTILIGPTKDNVWTEWTPQTMTWSGYSLITGQKLWGPTEPYNSSLGYFDVSVAHGVAGYGNLYTFSMTGEVHCYNLQTGVENWSWSAGSAGIDSPYGTWPLGTWTDHDILADGKFYVAAGHDYTPPIFKGAKLYALNATTGELIWDTLNFNQISGPAVADGIMIFPNAYDNQIYAFGKGQSRITVDAPSVGVTTRTPITIKGTITDISPGTTQQAVAANFPNGLPCVSDTSQNRFMEAVYQQQQMPTNLTGVPIVINVVDANGNYRTIGSTTSNAYGIYSLTWTPDITGDYTVIAAFAGTESYYSSDAATAFHASEPEATSAPSTTPTLSMADQYFLPMSIGIIIAIIVVDFATILSLRKHP
jgi:hypothetical protein